MNPIDAALQAKILAAPPPDPGTPWAEPIPSRLRRWIAQGPEDWTVLPAEVQAELQAHRVQRETICPSTQLPAVWGALGHLARHMDLDQVPHGERVRHLNAWGLLGGTVPSPVLNHQSLPGVADGWLVLTELYIHWRCILPRTTGTAGVEEERAAHGAIDMWSQRLLGHHPPKEWPRQWRLGLFQTLVALQKSASTRPIVLWGVLSALLASNDHPWPKSVVSLRVRRDLAVLALATPSLRKELADHAMDLHGALDGRIHLTSPSDPPAAAVWEGILEVYQVHCRREKRRDKTRVTPLIARESEALERTMRAWLEAGFVPMGLKRAAVRGALTELARRAPDLHGKLLACRLETALPSPDKAAPVARPRL